jgi:hypothetical protein
MAVRLYQPHASVALCSLETFFLLLVLISVRGLVNPRIIEEFNGLIENRTRDLSVCSKYTKKKDHERQMDFRQRFEPDTSCTLTLNVIPTSMCYASL